jgi:hypothetical protein
LVVFRPHIRESLLITDPSEKQFFTNSELELISGIPSKEGDQDSLKELMTMSDEEIRYWESQKLMPDYMIKDRFEESDKSIDSNDKKMVYKTSNIRENNIKLS